MITPVHLQKISSELSLRPKQVEAAATLLDEGSTVPFISRYRKEITGSLDEVKLTHIRDRLVQLRELDKRRATVMESIESQGKMTDELKEKILAAETMSVLEDLYLPYKPKRRTRATIAKEKGLEPLALQIWQQEDFDLEKAAVEFVSLEKKVESTQEALAGARDIMAEWINEDSEARSLIRELFLKKGIFRTKVIKGKEGIGLKFKDYFDWQEPVINAPSHRILAMRRAENEEVVTLRVLPPEEDALLILESLFVKAANQAGQEVRLAVHDSYKRLLSLSMETEIRLLTKEKADKEAIQVFAQNLRELLMASPLGQRNVLGIDPGFRTGCKVVCLDRQGKLLHNDTIYPHQSPDSDHLAAEAIIRMCEKFSVEFIAIGNGTASRETEIFIRSIKLPKAITVVVVNESGASIYSASEVAREEFPNHDVTVRGAISIARRLMDPLAELVKIDPKSIGVGQYQHDVDQSFLKQALDDVVISSVNQVGVEMNTASKELLMYVSGLGPALGKAIVEYRNQNGPFKSRDQLLNVPRLSSKVFEQAAGFLRIRNAGNPLDTSAVHPERYPLVEKMARDLNCTVQDLIKEDRLRSRINLQQYVVDDIGLPTLNDIVKELAKPGRDPRTQFEVFKFEESVMHPEDLKPGMKLPGIVTNVTKFGVFVDVGVHLDGLVHVSQISDKYVQDPSHFVKLNQKVTVTVLEVDLTRKRIALSLRSQSDAPKKNNHSQRW